MNDVRAFTYGIALGAGAMFLYDPERGASRRARLREATTRGVHELEHVVQVGRRDLVNRVHGVEAKARGLPSRSRPVSPDVLIARVRSRLGRVSAHAHAIEVNPKEGNGIELKGPALTSEHDRIVRAVSRVPGVRFVDDDLVVYAEADGIAGLQGGERHPSHAVRLPPATRLVIGAVMAAALLSPLAPFLVKTALFATMRSLLHDVTPEVLHAALGGEEEEQGQRGKAPSEERQERRGDETAAYPT